MTHKQGVSGRKRFKFLRSIKLSIQKLRIFFGLDVNQDNCLITGIDSTPDPTHPRHEPMDISSVIVSAKPEQGAHLKSLLEAVHGVEVHVTADDGRMIATIEAESEKDTVKTFELIGQRPGVLAVSMAYHQVETNPDEEA